MEKRKAPPSFCFVFQNEGEAVLNLFQFSCNLMCRSIQKRKNKNKNMNEHIGDKWGEYHHPRFSLSAFNPKDSNEDFPDSKARQ